MSSQFNIFIIPAAFRGSRGVCFLPDQVTTLYANIGFGLLGFYQGPAWGEKTLREHLSAIRIGRFYLYHPLGVSALSTLCFF
jgi:hypothetical protein